MSVTFGQTNLHFRLGRFVNPIYAATLLVNYPGFNIHLLM
jgi:hypothetical protein